MSPRLHLLGPVQLLCAPGPRPRAPERVLELVAFLSLHPWHNSQLLDAALWPSKRITAATRNVPLSAARSWLGTDENGHPHVGLVAEDGYALHDVETDWAHFQRLTGAGAAQCSTPQLLQALDLVTGQPLSGVNPVRYTWAERDKQLMISAICQVALEVCRRALHDADMRTLALAAATGLQVDPADETLWRHALLAARLSGVPGRETDVRAQMLHALSPLGELEPETLRLLHTG